MDEEKNLRLFLAAFLTHGILQCPALYETAVRVSSKEKSSKEIVTDIAFDYADTLLKKAKQ